MLLPKPRLPQIPPVTILSEEPQEDGSIKRVVQFIIPPASVKLELEALRVQATEANSRLAIMEEAVAKVTPVETLPVDKVKA